MSPSRYHAPRYPHQASARHVTNREIRRSTPTRRAQLPKGPSWLPKIILGNGSPEQPCGATSHAPEQPSQPQINSWAMSDRPAGVMDLAGTVGDVALSRGIAFADIS